MLYYEILRADFPVTEKRVVEVSKLVQQLQDIADPPQNKIQQFDTLQMPDEANIGATSPAEQETIKTFRRIADLSSDIRHKIQQLQREDPFADNPQLAAAQKELADTTEQQSETSPGSFDSDMESTKRALARQSSFKKVQACKAHLRAEHQAKVQLLQSQLNNCQKQLDDEQKTVTQMVVDILAEKRMLSHLRTYMRQLLDALRMRVSLEEQDALQAVAERDTDAGAGGKISIQRRGSFTQRGILAAN